MLFRSIFIIVSVAQLLVIGCVQSENSKQGLATQLQVDGKVVDSGDHLELVPFGKKIIFYAKNSSYSEELTFNRSGTGNMVGDIGSSRFVWQKISDNQIKIEYVDKNNLRFCVRRYSELDYGKYFVCYKTVSNVLTFNSDGVVAAVDYQNELFDENKNSISANDVGLEGFKAMENVRLDVIQVEAAQLADKMSEYLPTNFKLYLPLSNHSGVSGVSLSGNGRGQVFLHKYKGSNSSDSDQELLHLQTDDISVSEGDTFSWSFEDNRLDLIFDQVTYSVYLIYYNDAVADVLVRATHRSSGHEMLTFRLLAIDKELKWESQMLSRSMIQTFFEVKDGHSVVGSGYPDDVEIQMSTDEIGTLIFSDEYNVPVYRSLEGDDILRFDTYRLFSNTNHVETSDRRCVRQGTCSIYSTRKYKIIGELEGGGYIALRNLTRAHFTVDEQRSLFNISVSESRFDIYNLVILKRNN